LFVSVRSVFLKVPFLHTMDGANPHGVDASPHGGSMATMFPDLADDVNDTPTITEYKKLKRVMRIMTKFYEDGSLAKLDQAQDTEEQVQKVRTDLKMVNAQLDSLRTFPKHPKRKTYETELVEEKEKLEKLNTTFTAKAEEFRKLYEWSNGIVEVTKWLALGLDDYCVNHLKMDLGIVPEPLPRPTKETYQKYKEGFQEIHFNLEESQDFFKASLDGRLRRYHQIEKELIEAQLKAIEDFPPINARKAYWQEELQKDLDFVIENMKETPQSTGKRGRMLDMHRDFVSTLTWFQNKLDTFAKELGIEESPSKPSDVKSHPSSAQVEFIQNMEDSKRSE